MAPKVGILVYQYVTTPVLLGTLYLFTGEVQYIVEYVVESTVSSRQAVGLEQITMNSKKNECFERKRTTASIHIPLV